MSNVDPRALVREFVATKSEQAFRLLVDRYTPLVYSTAVRRLNGDFHRAQDVAQIVFSDFAKKATRLTDTEGLGAWLHRHTCFVTSTLIRAESRRQKRESMAAQMNTADQQTEPDWNQLAPYLDEAINQLNAEDRSAIMLKYFEKHDLRRIGQLLTVSEDAAQKRVVRAVDKLRRLLEEKGLKVSSTSLMTVLASQIILSVPSGLSAAIATASFGSVATTTTFLALMALKKIQIITGAAILTAFIVPFAIQQSKLRHLQGQMSKRDQITPTISGGQKSRSNKFRLPAPAMPNRASSSKVTPKDKAAELHAQFHPPKLSIEQAEKFVVENQRSPASLVAAFRTSGEARFLEEAMEKFPQDAQVAFEALFKADPSPDDRRKWIDALKNGTPDNALANYLSAQDYFKSGQNDLAVRELEAAFQKPKFNDLTLERMQINEEAYRANGYTEAQSRSVAMFQLPLPLLKEMGSLAENMVQLSESYRQAGDTSSAEAAVAIALNLGEQFRNSGNALLVHQLLGLDIEQSALKTMDPNALFGPTGRTVGELLQDLKAERAALSALTRETVHLQDRMTPQDWISYIDRMKLLGEPNANRWLRSKYGSK